MSTIPINIIEKAFNTYIYPHLRVAQRGYEIKISLYKIFHYVPHRLLWGSAGRHQRNASGLSIAISGHWPPGRNTSRDRSLGSCQLAQEQAGSCPQPTGQAAGGCSPHRLVAAQEKPLAQSH